MWNIHLQQKVCKNLKFSVKKIYSTYYVFRDSARVSKVRFENKPGWFCASLLFAHFL